MKQITYSNEKISNTSFQLIKELGRDEVNARFPYLAGRENARVIKLSFPVGIESHDGGTKRILDASTAKDKAKSLKDMPIHFAFDEAGLPSLHHDGDEQNRPEVGHILEAEMIGDNVVCYALLHPVTQKRATELIQANRAKLGNSWEIIARDGILDEANNTETITDWEWVGLAILDKEAAAYPESKVLVANKQVQEVRSMGEVEVKTGIIKVVDETVARENAELKAKMAEVDKAKLEAEKKDIADKAAEKATAEAEIKIKEIEKKANEAQEALDKITKQVDEETKKRNDETQIAEDKARKDKAVVRTTELKEFMDTVKKEEDKTKILTMLEKMSDEEYDIFKLGKIKTKTKDNEMLTSMGPVIPSFASKTLGEVTPEDLQKTYGKWAK